MDIGQAIRTVKKGGSIARSGWAFSARIKLSTGTYFGNPTCQQFLECLAERAETLHAAPYYPDSEDLLAEDWFEWSVEKAFTGINQLGVATGVTQQDGVKQNVRLVTYRPQYSRRSIDIEVPDYLTPAEERRYCEEYAEKLSKTPVAGY